MTPFPDRRRPDTCPSDYRFDRLAAGELDGPAAESLRRHAAACSVCGPRFSDLEAARTAFAADAPPLRPRTPIDRPRPPRRWWVVVAPALVVAAAIALWLRPPPEGGGTRVKGGPRLGFFVQRGASVRPGGPGEIVAPGDRLQLTVTAAEPTFVAVVSRDGGGSVSVYFPTGPFAVSVPTGEGVPLPLSTVLDATLGPEDLFAFFCRDALPVERLRTAVAAGHVEADAARALGCRVDRVGIEKRSP